MPSSRVLLVLFLASGTSLPAAAQTSPERPRTVAGVCGATNWACVAECIDAECVDKCLREDCEKALDRLKACTVKAGCAPDDTQCASRTCGRTCQRSFEPAPPSPEKERADPCQGLPVPATKPPEALVGLWTLAAASLPEEQDGGPERIEAEPRADYARTLQVRPDGCFVLRTALEEATLGQGNKLVVRAWGTVELSGEDRLTLRTRDGQAVGPVCGDKRVIPLSRKRLKFRGGSYLWRVEDGTLTLMVDDPTKQTFQFDRTPPEGGKK
ncbi:hypothetical protein [Myxococcus sp. RHSTA-1-4]|uniref:hypothetical protein n=1 Tax=Myxococcus sp. RHSTA-1-4 TaxID=2874601 RepID=UPI001CBDD4AF|nr:hypothetical protein [Myxococcus sp. RHSTA-1-4]MBZ4415156.1 hypothetical protein [Myxococcus sp. RHSTA-1-4]